jgi:hypothetical protein
MNQRPTITRKEIAVLIGVSISTVIRKAEGEWELERVKGWKTPVLFPRLKTYSKLRSLGFIE